MGDDGEGMEIARTILPMANNLRLDVVGEGVETISTGCLAEKTALQIWPGILLFQTAVRRWDLGIIGRRPDVAGLRANQVAQQMLVQGEHNRRGLLGCCAKALPLCSPISR